MLKQRLLLVVLISTLTASPTQLTYAGTAPPTNSPGGSIAPDPTSTDAQASAEEISLTSQTIEIAVSAVPDATELTGNASDKVQATVTGKYVLRNTFSSDIAQGLSFPLSDLSGLKDAQGNVQEVQGFGASANGTPVQFSVVTRTNPYGDSEPPIKWVVFSATIPARDEVTISTTHTSPATGQMPVAKFNFALDTANAWAGRVGESEIVVRLPYPASRENVFLSESTPGGRISGDTVRWVRRRFEPRASDNFVVSLLAPQIWQAILDARAAAAANPTDAEAQRDLAKAYRAAILLDNGVPQGGTRQFVAQAEKAYEQAIKLNPNSAELRMEYAQLLSDLHLAEDLTNPRRAAARLRQIVEVLQGALKIDPNNAAAIKLLAQMKTLAADLTTRNPSRATNALNAAVAEAEKLLPGAAAPASEATPTVAPSADATAVATPEPGTVTTSVTPTMSAPQATAIVAAQATVAASSAFTTTPDAPQATAIAQAQATLEAHATEMTTNLVSPQALPTVTAAPAAAASPTATSPSGTRSGATTTGSAANGSSTTVVQRMGLMSALSIACGAIILLGILAAVLVALFGRRQAVVKSDSATTTSNSTDDSTKGS
jgi:tetratricopeptide (TPR) repeat protein